MFRGHLQDPVAGTNDGTFWKRLQDFDHTYFLNSTQKHTKLNLTSYSTNYKII